jgi:hypothetical protein
MNYVNFLKNYVINVRETFTGINYGTFVIIIDALRKLGRAVAMANPFASDFLPVSWGTSAPDAFQPVQEATQDPSFRFPNALDPAQVIDLTEPISPRHPRRRPDSVPERPSKRRKVQTPEIVIDISNNEAPSHSEPTPVPPSAGSLSQVKCAICLEPPTDLCATPCGKSFLFDQS